MPKKAVTESGQEPTGKEIRVPADSTIKTFNGAFNDVAETIDGAKEELKDASDIAKKKFLHIPSFKVVKTLYDKFGDGDAKNAEKLAVWLANFDKYRKFYKLDELANLQGRLFGEGEIGGNKDVNGVAREVDEDGEEDPRPSHLRQPGASATSNPVADLAAKAGAGLKKGDGEDPIDQVGRGKPH
jgi:hypothetical protein